MSEFDVTIVSGRRPELLKKTLGSFQDNLFRNFEVSNVFVNIDPFGGSDEDQVRCVDVVLQYFPDARIYQPEECSFTKAVKTLWQMPSKKYFFHLEDDWVLHEPIFPSQIADEFKGKTRQVSLMCKEKNWNGTDKYHGYRKKLKLMGVKVWHWHKPEFTTSPSFIENSFAKKCASMMDEGLDPEKQFQGNQNPPLEDFSSQYRNRFHVGQKQPNIITDIGRAWRAKQGLIKHVENGVSTWVQELTHNSV